MHSCTVTRAIHLELVLDMSTNAFLMAFRRFVSRRGLPRMMCSDNALTFKRAAKDLKQMYDVLCSSELKDYCTTHRITWRFIVERAPWWGGFWERMVGSVKSCLKRNIGKAALDVDQITTVLTEVEAVINSRPMTYVYSEPNEPNVLTPAHFLCGRRLTTLPHHKRGDVTSTRTELVGRWSHRQRLMNMFWNRWAKEYLYNLRSAHARRPQSSSGLNVGDVVIVHDDHVPRLFWRTGRILECFPGRDGNVRACKIKLCNGSEVRRPVQRLYPLEMS